MNAEGNPYRDPADPRPPAGSPAPRWKVPRAAVTVGLAAFLAMAGAGVAFAVGGSGGSSTTSSGSTSESPSSTTPSSTLPGGRHPMGPGMRGGFGPSGPDMGAVVHGTYTVRNGTGYKNVEVQVGQVQAGVSSTSITVKSSDGFSQTYTVQPSTVVNSQAGGISTVKSGDQVRIQATQQGGGYTATDIVDTTQIGSSRQGFGFTPPAPPSGDGTQPAPAA